MTHNDHPGAQWFPDAGLGLFVHWGIASAHGDIKLSWGMVEDHHSPADASVSPDEVVAVSWPVTSHHLL